MKNEKRSRGDIETSPVAPPAAHGAAAESSTSSPVGDAIPLCRYEKLAMRENHLRGNADRRAKPSE